MSNINFYRTMYRPMITDSPPEPTGEVSSLLVYNIRSQQLTNYSSGSETYTVYGYNGLASSAFANQPVVGGFINNTQADHVVNTGTAKLHSIFFYDGQSNAANFLAVSFSSSNGTNNPPVYWDKIIFKFRTGSYSPDYIYDRKDATTRITTAGSSTIYTFYWEAGTIGYDGTGPIYWNNNNLDPDSSDTIVTQFGVLSYSASDELSAVMGVKNSSGCDYAVSVEGMDTYWFSGSSNSITENLTSLKGLYTDRSNTKATDGNYKFFDGVYYTASINTGSAPYYLGPVIGATYSSTNNNFSTSDFCSISGSMTVGAGGPTNAVRGWYCNNNNDVVGAMTTNYTKTNKEIGLSLIASSVRLKSFFYYVPLNEVWLGFTFQYNTGGVFPRYHGMTDFRNLKTLYLDNGSINGYIDLQDQSLIRGWGYSSEYGSFIRYGIEATTTIANPNPDYNPIADILYNSVGDDVNYSINNIYPLVP